MIFDEFMVHLYVNRITILLPRAVCIGAILVRIGQSAIGQKIKYVVIAIGLYDGPGSSSYVNSRLRPRVLRESSHEQAHCQSQKRGDSNVLDENFHLFLLG
jgi:hypothetical protein